MTDTPFGYTVDGKPVVKDAYGFWNDDGGEWQHPSLVQSARVASPDEVIVKAVDLATVLTTGFGEGTVDRLQYAHDSQMGVVDVADAPEPDETGRVVYEGGEYKANPTLAALVRAAEDRAVDRARSIADNLAVAAAEEAENRVIARVVDALRGLVRSLGGMPYDTGIESALGQLADWLEDNNTKGDDQ